MTHLQPDDRVVQKYYQTLAEYEAQGVGHELAVKSAFHEVLAATGRPLGWTLIPELQLPGKRVRPDGTVRDAYGFTLGYWEAKDVGDDLEREVQAKIDRGYPLQNTIFQAPHRALLFQDSQLVLDADLTDRRALCDVVGLFFGYREPEIEQFHAAVAAFKTRIPELAAGLLAKIEQARAEDAVFRAAFQGFVDLCREAVNPNLSEKAVEEMLIQHLLTERVVRSVFGNPDFTRKNVIAAEIEKVIDALTARHLSRNDFIGKLDLFYRAIEEAARHITDYAAKQDFLNTIYEQFFQGFSVEVADTHGIVYTPQPLVDFMVRSVDKLLQRHFGEVLGSAGVHVLDPFTGTGNFILRVMEAIPKTQLPAKYRAELHANEVMLLPYYIAALNIEHAYFEKTGRYEPFPGIVLVDTFDLVEGKTIGMFSPENTQRAQRQRQSPIKVILGNPPYNAHQLNENDNNKNRKYKVMDGRVAETYTADSTATLKSALSDPYVKAYRWASDRIGDQGVVAYVSNNSFVDDLAFDGMRKHLRRDFDAIYVLDLGGNVRKNPKLSGTTHNVFGIQVGVVIALLVRTSGKVRPDRAATIYYARTDEFWKKGQKYDLLDQAGDLEGIAWRELEPNARHTWLTGKLTDEWEELVPLGGKGFRDTEEPESIFADYSAGINTSRDAYVYAFSEKELVQHIEPFIEAYNTEVLRYRAARGAPKLEGFLKNSDIKWSRNLKRHLSGGRIVEIEEGELRPALYRPFVRKKLFFDQVAVDERGRFPKYFPTLTSPNSVICLSGKSHRDEFSVLISAEVADYHLCASRDGFQCFPFYVYDEDGGNRRENITDWALATFQARYNDATITKWDVFHYVYAVLHHPAYRARYAADLKRSLPRLPFAPAFRPFAEIGAELARLHVHYEEAREYPLRAVEAEGVALDWRVGQMKWLDKEKTALRYNDFLTLTGFPPEAHEYRLGNRSALDWLVDQYRVKTDARSGLTHDPNRPDAPDYLVRLLKRITTVSVETQRLVGLLPALGLPEET